jgi:hypothetical protein
MTDVRRAVLELRTRKGMVLDAADHDTWSAGSFFTNPVVNAGTVPEGAPAWPQPDGRVKTSAAWLIERAGFGKGYGRPGPAALSSKHTLALTNRGGASAGDLVVLARAIRDGVADQRLGVSVALGGVDDVEAGVERFLQQQSNAARIGGLEADLRAAESEHADPQSRPAELALLHQVRALSPGRCRSRRASQLPGMHGRTDRLRRPDHDLPAGRHLIRDRPPRGLQHGLPVAGRVQHHASRAPQRRGQGVDRDERIALQGAEQDHMQLGANAKRVVLPPIVPHPPQQRSHHQPHEEHRTYQSR